MKFGPVPIDEAEGAVLAHATAAGEKRFRKAHRLSGEDVAALKAAGIGEVVAAVLAKDDLGEDAAAAKIAAGMSHRNIEVKPAATGRVNLHAAAAGVFTVDAAMIDAINAVDPAITIATLAQYAPVEQDQMVATVKIIPFAVAASLVDRVVKICAGREIFAVNTYRPSNVGVIQTVLPGIKPSVLDKTLRVTEARLARSGGRLTAERRTPHEVAPVAAAASALARDNDMVVIFGASAMSDFADVVPAAIERAGGTVIRAGMPVDPGNLLVLGTLDGKRVVGAPGCARSPKENGFDWVLDRLIAGLDVTAGDIAGMGVGGLLMEIPTRPQPREPAPQPARSAAKVDIVLLAAGRSSRMGGPNKLLALFDGEPLVRRTAARALGSKAASTIVVTGHQRERVRSALAGLEVKLADNPDFADGLASSLKAGIAKVAPDAAGAMIVLGDMPGVSSKDLDSLIDAFRRSGGHAVVRASHQGKRGNPVLLPRSLFAAVAQLEGDTGARHLVEAEGLDVIDVEIGQGASIDVDTREAVEGAGGVLQD
ncbi:4-diphosphocytidyl-2C-methyl-D-erythritol kinase [Mesorhizobium sp. M2D.F.Ca.ET.185.01.1.1]|uniref:NTP transferase domain-containing protein n=1 Tax=unclassified Mesorhizobium TaxID=325217 RepID=UPI000FCC7312|nr:MULTISPECIES: molybdopterin-binding/glycosyltransferase family 2 protein [unclassified Mesorhizobium]TGP80793.1 4-diphosphocytidyl-2C-methyl-D-erythritol kinase [bacterium M00.F.Ca.ET.227.01.1.1]TGP90577.1 4-diphosphocytidyl-2C-methyl-D-erythritol kinase [bacterium M00.F.Ca.ET.221.01.1.1]TGP97256.1 4-diphosphocytidyl-2C-methyl-D-erythritol kinase [bacterium M00.F.Ca.ET.222.01.1.1]TGU02067.1 4-diphosphocytidyl-2C-methyl-D-erythritol kinase [bacterium M00.F.Ca.ET.163.01.1.1]TGU26126.1 4-dipho